MLLFISLWDGFFKKKKKKNYFYCYRHQTRQARFSRHRTARPPDAADLQLKAEGQSMARGRLSCGGKASGVFPEMIHQRSYLSTSAITSPAGSDHCGTTRSRSELAGNWSSQSADRTGSPCLCREGRRIKGGKKNNRKISKRKRDKDTN